MDFIWILTQKLVIHVQMVAPLVQITLIIIVLLALQCGGTLIKHVLNNVLINIIRIIKHKYAQNVIIVVKLAEVNLLMTAYHVKLDIII